MEKIVTDCLFLVKYFTFLFLSKQRKKEENNDVILDMLSILQGVLHG